MTDQIKIGINGAAGRMGRRLVALVHADSDLQLTAALESEKNPCIGQDAGDLAGVGNVGVEVTTEPTGEVDVLIDFSVPAGFMKAVELCEKNKIALVAATTGLTDDQKNAIENASKSIPVVFAPSMSLAVNLMMKLVQDAARVLKSHPEGVDVEIIERHHRFKEDAPSGTALRFGEIVAKVMGQTEHTHGREGRPGIRPQSEIGYHALRTGDNVGEHTIVFGMIGETIDMTVRGQSRDSYAFGALSAAKFLMNQSPALYSMADVLNLDM